MTEHDRLKETDPDLAGIEAALKRAALNALRLSIQTNTPFYVFENGKIINLLEVEPDHDALLQKYMERTTTTRSKERLPEKRND
jgi:hypothetical protein